MSVYYLHVYERGKEATPVLCNSILEIDWAEFKPIVLRRRGATLPLLYLQEEDFKGVVRWLYT
jgi:hypothetical protein